ncbi:hypothetical protein CANCADRAFT_3646 [Tortispora caseinolytica NRRL Y-17796]|uniref:Altered inheritance of mitochondria protein 9, mitochondrial n=1 Tax=Tortispora caseinolytica NRRL Y-17796 TaxID=767744 RepID=A0A1E4TB69_9ASCO|nr:hypothetical protein CANCADRAFT_3646 [Tortispora caseinolytica NRRL Y-17796]
MLQCLKSISFRGLRYVIPHSGLSGRFYSTEKPVDAETFFQYSWGSWLSNNAYERKRRTTYFDLEALQDLVRQISGPDSVISSMNSIFEGKHHRIYSMQLKNDKQYVLRIPYSLGDAEQRERRLKSEVATMDFVQKKVGLSVPNILSWSPTSKNSLKTAYMLMDYSSATPMMRDWDPMADKIVKKDWIDPVSKAYCALASVKFNKFGSLYFTDDVSKELQSDLPYEGETDLTLTDRWRIGPSTDPLFLKTMHNENVFSGPFNTPQEYVSAIASAQIALHSDNEFAVYIYKKFETIAMNILEVNGMENDIVSARLCYHDLDASNIGFEEDKKPVFFDFEGSSIIPFSFVGAPRFLRYNGIPVFSKTELEGYEKFDEATKRQIDFMAAYTENQFIFEFGVKQNAPQLIGAFTPRLKRLNELIRLGSSTLFYEDYIDLGQAMVEACQHWALLSGAENAEPPLTFSEDEISKLNSIFDEWVTKQNTTPFLLTKGWVPQQQFEDMVSKGMLVKNDTGDYEFKAPETNQQ